MSLRKHQSVKALDGKRVTEKLRMAKFGHGVDADVMELIEHWNAIFIAHPDVGNLPPEVLEKFSQRHWLYSEKGCPIAPMNPGDQTRLLVGKLRQAMARGDATFFRNLANGIERLRQLPIDRLRSWLMTRFYLELSNKDGGPVAKGWEDTRLEVQPMTIGELLVEVNRVGIRVDERQLRRMCKEIGIEPAKGQRGRPRKPTF